MDSYKMRTTIKWFNKLASMSVLVLLSATSNAQLISTDFKSTGDGLITFDTDTQLEWLDLSFTSMERTSDTYIDNSYAAVRG